MVKARTVVSSNGKFFGMNTITGEDGTPYMTRAWIGRLRLHIFHRPDHDEDCHDHPWSFTTFPLWPIHGYVEEVATIEIDPDSDTPVLERHHQIVPVFRFSYRPATHCHRVLGAHDPRGDIMGADAGISHFDEIIVSPGIDPARKIVTLVWRSNGRRDWGFLKVRDGRWCWVAWRDYVFAGGKDGPCQ